MVSRGAQVSRKEEEEEKRGGLLDTVWKRKQKQNNRERMERRERGEGHTFLIRWMQDVMFVSAQA